MSSPGTPPDFVGVGTQNAGSGWWHDLLLMHPAIRAPRGGAKELHFFDEFCRRDFDDADARRYHAHFPRADGTLTGEWTPRYIYDPWTPLLLSRAAPDAKLLVMLGDPIERYRDRLARARLEAESEDEELYMADAAGRGRYATQLRRLWSVFDRDRTLVLQHERCRAEPRTQYARTLRFLGVSEDFVARPLGPRPGKAQAVAALRRLGLLRSAERAPLWPDIEASLHEELDAEVLALRELVPDLRIDLWPNFREVA